MPYSRSNSAYDVQPKGTKREKRFTVTPDTDGFTMDDSSPHRPAQYLHLTWLFLIGFLAVVALTVTAWPFLPRRYEAPATILLLVGNRDDMGASSRPTAPMPDENVTQSDIDLIGSPGLAGIVIAKNHLMDDPEFSNAGGLSAQLAAFAPILAPLVQSSRAVTEADVRLRLQSHLRVVRDRRSYTVTLAYWSSDPNKAAALTTTLLDAYVALQRERKSEGIRRTTGWLEERVSRLRSDARQADAAVRSFMEDSGLIDAGAQMSLDRQLATLSTELAEARARSIETGTRAAMLQRMFADQTIDNAPEVLASPAIQKLKEAQATALARPGAWAPEAKEMAQQIAAEAQRIVAGSLAESQVWRERTDLLQAALVAVRGDLTKRSRSQLRLDDLQRDAKAIRTVLEDSLVRINNQTSLVRAISPDVEIVAAPEPPTRATFPNPYFTALGTLVAATMCGGLLAWRGHGWDIARRTRPRPRDPFEVRTDSV